MHPFMLRSFQPFFRPGNCLELGSFKGDFTQRLLPIFDDVTCVEASDVAIETARQQVGDKVTFVNSRFETASLPCDYDNIVMTHVLEHLDDPVPVLKRVNAEWLARARPASSWSARTPTLLRGRSRSRWGSSLTTPPSRRRRPSTATAAPTPWTRWSGTRSQPA